MTYPRLRRTHPTAVRSRRSRRPLSRVPGSFFRVGIVGACLDGVGQGIPEELATFGQGELFADRQDGAGRSGNGEATHPRGVSNGLLEYQAFGFGLVFDRERWHPCLRG